ncbi:hypothetical protein CHU98_g5348 [Xylaria longipes]|nr:hypothetical protein CHU98_g5348 [Xylaria longipes]
MCCEDAIRLLVYVKQSALKKKNGEKQVRSRRRTQKLQWDARSRKSRAISTIKMFVTMKSGAPFGRGAEEARVLRTYGTYLLTDTFCAAAAAAEELFIVVHITYTTSSHTLYQQLGHRKAQATNYLSPELPRRIGISTYNRFYGTAAESRTTPRAKLRPPVKACDWLARARETGCAYDTGSSVALPIAQSVHARDDDTSLMLPRPFRDPPSADSDSIGSRGQIEPFGWWIGNVIRNFETAMRLTQQMRCDAMRCRVCASVAEGFSGECLQEVQYFALDTRRAMPLPVT